MGKISDLTLIALLVLLYKVRTLKKPGWIHRGVILLLDDRFGRRPYSALYAELWQAQPVRDESDAGRRMKAFWEKKDG